MKKIKERFLCVYLVMCMIFVLCPTVVYAEDAPGVYGDFYVVDNSTGAAVTAGNGVSYASGVLTVQRDGCRVKMKNGVTATTQRIIFDHRPTGSGHSQIILENVHINASDGIAIENKQGYRDQFQRNCELIGTVESSVIVEEETCMSEWKMNRLRCWHREQKAPHFIANPPLDSGAMAIRSH